MREGEIIFDKAVGFADVENLTKLTPTTPMRIASISKSLTSAGVAKLVEAGLVPLDASVNSYVSIEDFPPKPEGDVTLAHLLSNTSGVRSYRGFEFYLRDSFPTTTESLAVFGKDPLLSEPGARYLYSTHGFTLVAAMIEAVTKQNFLEYMKKEVFSPLEMNHTFPEDNEALLPGRCRYYMRKQPTYMGKREDVEEASKVLADPSQPVGASRGLPADKTPTPKGIQAKSRSNPASFYLRNAPPVDVSWKWAGGGFVSTASDIAKFGDAMLHDELVSRETREVFWTPLVALKDPKLPTTPVSTEYGLGWSVKIIDGRRIVSHGGGAVGASSYIFLDEERNLSICVLTNLQDVSLFGLAQELSDVFKD